jgi:hypothetical protein
MMAVLDKFPIRLKARARAGRACAFIASPAAMMLDLGYSSKLNARMGIPDNAARRRPALAELFHRPTAMISAGVRRSIRRAARSGVTEPWACSASSLRSAC